MARLRRLSGNEVLRILSDLGYAVHQRSGQNVKLRRPAPREGYQSLTFTLRDDMDKLALTAIYRFVVQMFPSGARVRSQFYEP